MYLPFVGGIKVIFWDVYISIVCAVKTCSYNASGRENVKAAESYKGVCRIWMLYMLVHKIKEQKAENSAFFIQFNVGILSIFKTIWNVFFLIRLGYSNISIDTFHAYLEVFCLRCILFDIPLGLLTFLI